MTAPNTKTFAPGAYLVGGDDANRRADRPDLLILNQPIAHFSAFARLWSHTEYRICADGGANRLYDMFKSDLEIQRSRYLPNLIHGDLDSLRDDVRAYYTAKGVLVSKDPDQYSTDFGKTMQKISSQTPSTMQRDVLILGTLAGRVDQGLGLLNEMIREEAKYENLRLWLFSESSVSFILRSGQNVIRGLLSSGLFTENIGIIPVYGPATISTTGLEWDVKEWDTRMGGQVSTSNHVKADEICIETNAPILFTIERASLEKTKGT
ncbi:thiamine pyrophosphokinase [Dothidotthia symphoricarpi CBS 119687]|uniref:Thiamine pyrophosphokinase n=1 Tax=Dothidotthia symphoricarpi CBS 119687 TaxID=1392245 RepID=A0A6A6A7L6_9PLEO|nr:thiamine pyrophosphokinase [Dothidotthia symphoricarpi CBS 119687]KAF2127830.1 thiamine pyrophosphokinase [Dothidotthia symphoricarpi CBS 119687]